MPYLKPQSSTLSSSKSSADSLHELTAPKFSAMRCGCTLFGRHVKPFATDHEIKTCAGVAPCLSPIAFTSGFCSNGMPPFGVWKAPVPFSGYDLPLYESPEPNGE